MNVTVIGASNGGKAAAADMTLAGHDVTLFEFPQFEENLAEVKEKGGINLVGEGRNGFARLHAITDDIEQALKHPDIIVNVMSAFGHKVAAKACAPYLKDGQIVVLNPGSTLGSLEYLQVLKEQDVDADIKIGDVHTLTYAARGSGAEVRILLEVKKLWLAAFPAIDTPEVLAKFKQLYPVTEAGKKVLDPMWPTSLQASTTRGCNSATPWDIRPFPPSKECISWDMGLPRSPFMQPIIPVPFSAEITPLKDPTASWTAILLRIRCMGW
jgi:opine dehydrogenase